MSTQAARIPEDLRTITASEVAEMLGVSTYQVYAWARLGVIPCVRLGRSVRFRLGALRAWMETQEGGAPERCSGELEV